MNNTIKIIALSMGLITFKVFADQQCAMSDLGWLAGEWQMKTDSKVISEYWQSVSKKTMAGIGETKKKDGTVSASETLRIRYPSYLNMPASELSQRFQYKAQLRRNVGYLSNKCNTVMEAL